MKTDWPKIPKILWPLVACGNEFTEGTGDQWVSGCPFCGKENHFYANPQTGQWDCKVCGESGNAITFLTKMAEQYAGEMRDSDWQRLARARGLPQKWLRRWPFPCPPLWLIAGRFTRLDRRHPPAQNYSPVQ